MGKKSLADLYVLGKEVTLGDEDDEVVVWVQKMNPVEHSTAVRRADAARARVLACRFDKESETYLAILDDVLVPSRDVLIEVLCITEEQRIAQAREAKVAAEEHWSTDRYLEGLRDAWNDELLDRYTEDPEDAEAKRVYAELTKFHEEVAAEIATEIESFRRLHEQMSDQELVDLSMEHRIKAVGDMAWMQEYQRTEIALGTRDAKNHRERIFPDRAFVDELQARTLADLILAFRELTVDPTEGKGSAVAPPSSTSSEPSEQEATAASSGPTAA